MYDEGNHNDTTTGGYYDTGGSYTHYNSSEAFANPPEKKKKKGGGFGKSLVKCLVLSLVFGSVSSAAFMGTNYLGKQYFGDAVTLKSQNVEKIDLAKTETNTASGTANASLKGTGAVMSVADIVENCMPSVVSITNVGTREFRTFFGTYEQESQSSGSGIIIGQNDTELLIVTNNHVISNAKEISVYFNSDGEAAGDDNVISAKIKGTDPSKDLAVIAVQVGDIPQETMNIIKIATVGDSAALRVGEQVIAIGNAYGYGLSTTTGIVSALNREVSVNADGQTITNRLIQVDAAINPGNSGGALLNSQGELIGINSVKFISEDVEGMGYAIPISDVESIIGDLMNKVTRDRVDENSRGYLGVADCVDVTEQAAKDYGMPVGIYVRTVKSGLGAEKAGMQAGDIITKLDGTAVSGYQQLREALSYYSAGETVPVTIQRMDGSGEGKEYVERTIEVTLCNAREVGARQ